MTEKKEALQDWYILRTMAQLGLSGDAYSTAEDLWAACRRNRKGLSAETFREDKAFLLREGFLHQEGRRLYLRRVWQYENAAARSLANILSANDLSGVSLPETLVVEERVLTAEQRAAVDMALRHRLSMILGGAGSGKTTLVQALARYRPRALPDCVLCAPTGKAARNLQEHTGQTVRTVHSALGMQPDDDFLGPVVWCYTGLVVVDEASMMTLEMLAGILNVAPRAARVVLVGDPHQLLSVGAGNVLPDLLALGVPHIRLESCHRQAEGGGALLENVRQFARIRRFKDLALDDSFQFLSQPDETQTHQTVCALGAERYLAGESIQVLSPFNHTGTLSARALNHSLRELVNPPSEENSHPQFPDLPFRGGDRVMITENDWKREVCNGDAGMFCLLPGDALRFGVLCGDGRTPSWDGKWGLKHLALAYAITVHKSQGSEYDTVILPLSRQFSIMLCRNLLYTAVSRARKRVILVGDPEAAEIALQRETPERRSMLVQKTRTLQTRSA